MAAWRERGAGARPDGLEHGTRVWVQDSEHARAGQFGVIVEVQGTHVVRVHFDEQWNGDRGEVIRRSFVIPADWKDEALAEKWSKIHCHQWIQ